MFLYVLYDSSDIVPLCCYFIVDFLTNFIDIYLEVNWPLK